MMRISFILNLLGVLSIALGSCTTTAAHRSPSEVSENPPSVALVSTEEIESTDLTEKTDSPRPEEALKPTNSTESKPPVKKNAPPRRYFRPSVDLTPTLPQVAALPKPDSPSKKSRLIDRSQLLKTVKSDAFYFSSMLFRFNTVTQSAVLQFERVPQRPEFDKLVEQSALFEAFFPSKEFRSVEEKKLTYASSGLGIEVIVEPTTAQKDALSVFASLLSLLLQRAIFVSEESEGICQFSFACDPVMSFSSLSSYGMYTNEGGERVFFSFNLKNDPEINFRLAY